VTVAIYSPLQPQSQEPSSLVCSWLHLVQVCLDIYLNKVSWG